MSHTQEQTEQRAIDLVHGRLAARPGPDLYLYSFPHPGGPLPEIGRRGSFIYGAHRLPARLADLSGREIRLSLTADKPLASDLSGRYQPDDALKADTPIAARSPYPPGTEQFLDPGEGWVMNAAEAAGQKTTAFEPDFWPRVSREELPELIAGRGITFIWRQAPDPGEKTARLVLDGLVSGEGDILVTAESPAQLEALASAPGAVYGAEAEEKSPLYRPSIYQLAARAAEARDRELAELRGRLEGLKREESALKARLTQLDDLDELRRRFDELGRKVADRTPQWQEARQTLDQARRDWEEASRKRDQKGLLGWLRPDRPEDKARRREEERRQRLEAAEKAMNTVRQEEEDFLGEARRLEERLNLALLDSESWAGRDQLKGELEGLRLRQDDLAAQIVTSGARTLPAPADFLKDAPLTLVLAGDLNHLPTLAARKFRAVLALVSRPPDHNGRGLLAALALRASHKMIYLGDFTFWPVWSGRAPAQPEDPDKPAWSGLIVTEDAEPSRQYLAEDGLFRMDLESPPEAPALSRLELGERANGSVREAPVNFTYIVPPANDPGPGQAPVLPGPARPQKKPASSPGGPGSGSQAARRTGAGEPGQRPDDGQGGPQLPSGAGNRRPGGGHNDRLPRPGSIDKPDSGRPPGPPGRILAGEPPDFDLWPRVPLVILEPAFEAPHLSHPWAWPSYGRLPLMKAWRLAKDQVWLAGREAWMMRLPASSPLGALWRLAGRGGRAGETSPPAKTQTPTFWEALDKATQEVWAIVPPFEQFWWRPLEEHFLAAARRRVKITILAAPPGPDSDRDYVSSAIRTLATYGCTVHLAAGFPGFLAVVDDRHLSWGHFIEGLKGASIWGGLKSAILPRAAGELGEILQLKLINEKMGRRGGGLRNCPRCGWPLLLINQDQPRGFSDEQPLKLGCLGDCGRARKNARRLDEREPFSAPPKCGVDHHTAYERIWRSGKEAWVCPRHPEGTSCPSYRVLPGDLKIQGRVKP